MMRRRRSLLFKILFGCAVLYIGLLLFVGRNSSHNGSSQDVERGAREQHGTPYAAGEGHKTDIGPNRNGPAMAGDVRQPVIERPDPDRLRFEEAMRKDAERAERRRRLVEEQKRQNDEDRQRRARDRVPVPFRNVINMNQGNSNLSYVHDKASANGQSAAYEAAVARIQPLIDQGLVVVKWNFEKEQPAVPGGPGENGEGINIVKESLSPDERAKFDAGWQNNAFNQYASDMMSLHRSLPDIRDEEPNSKVASKSPSKSDLVRSSPCKSLKYRDVLPSTTVVIIFHNEAWSVLLRTVHSVMDRSPPHLIKEIILVDDFSDLSHLKEPLDEYVAKLMKVRIMRNKKREGLIRARLLGASVATGDVIVFLDSHCECTIGWLEPLLDRIAENKSNVVTPIIDVLNDDSLKYQYSSAKSTSVGGFDWNLQFNWHSIPERERLRRKSPVEPVQSPTMAGGLFAISREYFEYLGTYDPGMDIWGGENLELSFRVWMCGGTLEQVLCSHVGHIFRSRSPYAWRTGTNVLKRNSIRLAQVWMDDYSKYYYERFNFDLVWMCGGVLETVLCSHVGHIFRKRSPYKWRTGVNVVKKNSVRLASVWMDEYAKYYFDRFNNDLGDYGDITSRKELRKRLNCKSFDWYLKNIFPELFVPGDAVASGEIRNKALGTFNGAQQHACIDSSVDKSSHNQPVKLWPCHNQGGNQFWMLSHGGEIRRDEGCIDFAGNFIMIYPCHGMKGNQEWLYGMDNTLRHRNTNMCIELTPDGTNIGMKPCTGIDRQIWYWKRKDQDTPQPSPVPVIAAR